MALRAVVFASSREALKILSLRETLCALRETLCPLATCLLAERAPQLARSLLALPEAPWTICVKRVICASKARCHA
jgi:hypothetical protein